MERRIDRYGGAWLDWEPAEILQDGGDVMGRGGLGVDMGRTVLEQLELIREGSCRSG